MVSPPFSINTAVPGDSDIVSQFPLLDRAVRDIVQSWILANHDTNGNHTVAKFPFQGSTPTTPSASIQAMYADSVGRFKFVKADGTIHFIGVPPGNVMFTAASTVPNGWLVADGSAVSRTTYVDLFTALGTTFGIGDGSTTFNLPDVNGRVIAGEDNAAGRLTAAGGMTGTTRGSTGGTQTVTLLTTNLPPYTPSGSVVTTNVLNFLNAFNNGGTNVGVGGTASGGNLITGPTVTSTSTFTGTAQGGVSTPTLNIPPTIILKAIIKT